MKWIFIAGLLVLIPMLAGLLRSNPKYLVHTAFAIGALPFFVVPALYVAPFSWAAWPGPVKGIEVSLIDAVALAVIISTRGVRIPTSFMAAFGVLAFAMLISTAVGFQAIPAIFYDWQVFRTVLLFIAVARLCATVPSAPLAIMTGMGVGLIYEAIFAAWQYVHGDPRPGGNLGHANFLGLASHFVVFPFLTLLLGGRRLVWPAAVVGAGTVIAVIGGSRATMGLFAVGSVLAIMLSLRQGMNSRKSAFAGAAALMLLVSAPVLWWAANQRSEQSKISSNEERTSMKLAARMMIADHPLGVGANQYVLVANMGGYSERAGVPWTQSSRSAPVHNTYYLVTAELGFLGLVGFALVLAAPIFLGFRLLRRPATGDAMALVPGLLATMLVVAIHLGFEWVFMHFVMHYLFAICCGMMVALAARSRAVAPRRVQVERMREPSLVGAELR